MRTTGIAILCLSMVLSVVSATYAVDFGFEIHGSLLQAIGTTNNTSTLKKTQLSAKTEFFGYNGQLNYVGTKGEKSFKFMDDESAAAFGVTKARLKFAGKSSDEKVKMIYELEVGAINWGDNNAVSKYKGGQGFHLGGDGINQETHTLYTDFQVPGAGKKHRIFAGLQPTKINKWVMVKNVAGLTYRGKSKKGKWLVGWYRGDVGADTYDNSSDQDFFVAKLGYKINPNFSLEVFGIYEEAGDRSSVDGTGTTLANHTYDIQNIYLGTTGQLKSGKFFANYDLIYLGGEVDFDYNDLVGSKDLDRQAFLANFTVGYKPSDQLKVYFNTLYVSGDDDSKDDVANNFDSIILPVKIGMIFFRDGLLGSTDRFMAETPYFLDKGLINISLTGEYKINAKNHVRSAIRYLLTAEDMHMLNKKENAVGTEFDLWYTYTLNKFVKLKVESAYLAPGAGADFWSDDGKSADSIVQLVAGCQLKF
ncbi:conserved hypothetical protein, secreted [Candidatus Magnetomorum sp. HK-1]|nr:conserved hypothetical protein, secreted [Candidatus Magnetomorum sp. HK-1]